MVNAALIQCSIVHHGLNVTRAFTLCRHEVQPGRRQEQEAVRRQECTGVTASAAAQRVLPSLLVARCCCYALVLLRVLQSYAW